jgi:transposase-like protein
MGKIRRKFDTSFKERLIEEIEAGRMTVTGAARKHQISPSVIHYWRQRSKEGKLIEHPSKRERALEKEVTKLKETIGDLYVQIELLKKVEAWKKRMRSVDSSIITGKNLARFVEDARS